jgi:hypothetical protein
MVGYLQIAKGVTGKLKTLASKIEKEKIIKEIKASIAKEALK